MATLIEKPKIDLTINMTLSESEARALLALTAYGHKQFLEMFYNNMGKSQLQPYENGLITFFNTFKELCPPILNRINSARKQFESDTK